MPAVNFAGERRDATPLARGGAVRLRPIALGRFSGNSGVGRFDSGSLHQVLRGGAVVACLSHTQEVVGAIPTPATRSLLSLH